MGENICIYSGTLFDKSTREHILQASFGAHWDSKTLICQEMQERFAGVIDNAVADGIFQLRSLFGTKNGRGKVPLPIKDVSTASGIKYELQPGMQPAFAKATYKIENNCLNFLRGSNGKIQISNSMTQNQETEFHHKPI